MENSTSPPPNEKKAGSIESCNSSDDAGEGESEDDDRVFAQGRRRSKTLEWVFEMCDGISQVEHDRLWNRWTQNVNFKSLAWGSGLCREKLEMQPGVETFHDMVARVRSRKEIDRLRSDFPRFASQSDDSLCFSLSVLEGRVVLVVNMDVKCSFSNGQFADLKTLCTMLEGANFTVLLVPCGQFLSVSEDDTDSVYNYIIQKMGRAMMNVIVLFQEEVNGHKTHPMFNFLKRHSVLYNKNSGMSLPIPWNFTKFLVGPNGHVVRFSAPKESPLEMLKIIVSHM